ncbi:MAG: DUF1501 domain-containing protein [Pirellulaceae bacterium]|jgi:uncharacterized protein (DUF1501 family)|nr:DUF1501 domain-containing protein [Pirellulaceae bacterium]MDP7302948.1 DUF1501 domain-containing protein [Pirellulaceae bacterium]HJN12255.1 DUF1501 domain-containing protein [Pirellulaceae bacterium]
MSRIKISTRRDFLNQGLGLVAVGAAAPSFLARSALAGPKAQSEEPILVVVQLSGGHDGLSAVVPYANDDYARNREQTRIPTDELLKVDDEIGFHPNLGGFKELFDQGSMAVVQAVGYPNPNRSHFRSMDIWHLANNAALTNSTATDISRGWLGKYCDVSFKHDNDPKLSLAVGTGKAPMAIQGREHPGLSFSRPDTYRYLGARNDKRRASAYRKLHEAKPAMASDSLQFVTRTAVDANASSDAIRELASQYKSSADYPRSRLAASLQTVASLIAGGLSTRVYYVLQGGYDTHAGQKARHDRLMTDLGDGVAAFQKDLAAQGNAERVLTLSFSEFGRRVKENWSQGTDHGTAGSLFLFGPGVKAGIHGEAPSLAEDDLDRGDLKHKIDFRSVYATVLEKWLGTQSQSVLDGEFPLLDCLQSA